MYISRNNNKADSTSIEHGSIVEALKLYMDKYDLSLTKLSKILAINEVTLGSYLQLKTDLKFVQMMSIMNLLGLTPEQLVGAKQSELTTEETLQHRSVKKIAYIFDHFDIKTLKKLRVIKPRAKVEEYEEAIKSFLGLDSIFQYDAMASSSSLFSKSNQRISKDRREKTVRLWLVATQSSFEKINNPNEFDKELLQLFVKRIPEYTQDAELGLAKVIKVLYGLGVTVLYQSYTSESGVFGATMLVNNKPCVVITDQYKKYHKVWLTLTHELYHILEHFDLLQSLSYHTAREDSIDLLFNEEQADQYARDLFVPADFLNKIKPLLPFSSKISHLSNKMKIDQSLIYGVYLDSLKEFKEDNHRRYSKYLKPSSVISDTYQLNLFGEGSIESKTKKLKDSLFNKIAI